LESQLCPDRTMQDAVEVGIFAGWFAGR